MEIKINVYTFKEKLPLAGEEVLLIFESGCYPYKVYDRVQQFEDWAMQDRAIGEYDDAEFNEKRARDILENGKSRIGLEDLEDYADIIPFEGDDNVIGWYYPGEIQNRLKENKNEQ